MSLKNDSPNKLKNIFSLNFLFKVVLPFLFFLLAIFLLYTVNKELIIKSSYTDISDKNGLSHFHLYEIVFSSLIVVFLLLIHRWYTKQLSTNAFTEINAEFNNLIYVDPLTNTLNKKAFWEDMTTYMLENKDKNAYLLCLDMEGFKRVNEVVGYTAGDLVLKQFASRIMETLKDEDFLCYRVGGDEFALFFSNEQYDFAKIEHISKKLIDITNTPFIVDNDSFSISLNVGIAKYPSHGLNPEELFKNSDLAIYEARIKGKNTYAVYTETTGIKFKYKKLIESLLLSALDNNEFYLMFQPKVENINNEFKLIGAEALLRWRNDKVGEISPMEFIPIAEEIGIMPKLGHWVFEETVKTLSVWNKLIKNNIKVSVNLSVHQLNNVNLARDFIAVLRNYNVSPKQIIIEITESTMMKDFDGSRSILKELSKCGFGISIDDFGTGYSSLSYLRKFDLDELKIDRSFTKDVLVDNKDRIVISNIISLAQDLGLNVVVEGVENKNQLDWFQDKGKIQVQGYYFSKPLLEKDFVNYWKKIN